MIRYGRNMCFHNSSVGPLALGDDWITAAEFSLRESVFLEVEETPAFREQGSSPSPDPNMLVPCSLVQSSKPGFEFSLGSSGTDLLSIAPHVYEIGYSGQPLSSHSILMSHTKAARQYVNTECS